MKGWIPNSCSRTENIMESECMQKIWFIAFQFVLIFEAFHGDGGDK